MSDPQPVQLPAEPLVGNWISVSFVVIGPATWRGEANCKHGVVSNTTYLTSESPTIDYASMVDNLRRQHALLVGCNCPYEASKTDAALTFAPATGIQPGEMRIIQELTATIAPPAKSFYFGGRLMCATPGAYQVEARMQIAKPMTGGGGGVAHVLLAGSRVISAPMRAEGALAVAYLSDVVNLQPNQPLAVAYLNTTPIIQDVQQTSLSVADVWVPI